MSKLDGFQEAKQRIVRAIDYRIQQLPLNGGILDAETNRAICERVDELKKLRAFVKGMVTQVADTFPSETTLQLIKKSD